MSLTSEIKNTAGSSTATGAIYIALISASLANMIPTVGDAALFRINQNLRDKWKKNEITPRQYWLRTTAAYYLINPAYYAIILLIISQVKGDYHKKLKVGAMLISSGLVLGIILQAIQKDEKQLSKEDGEMAKLLTEHPEIAKILKQPAYENISAPFQKAINESFIGNYDNFKKS